MRPAAHIANDFKRLRRALEASEFAACSLDWAHGESHLKELQEIAAIIEKDFKEFKEAMIQRKLDFP